jgi:DNA-binding GntR family transcriptional regulator
MDKSNSAATSGLGDSDDGSLSERIAEEIHRRILDGDIPLGSKLRQDAIASEFQVSRMPVREAFRALHGRGVIEILPRRGALVHGPTPRDIRENLEVRAELEGLGAELAAQRIDDAQLGRLRDALQQFETVGDLGSESSRVDEAADLWRRANEQFHTTLIEAADNSHLAASIQELRRRIPHNSTFAVLRGNTRLIKSNVAEHAAILEAVEARDVKKSRQLMKSHVLRTSEMVARRYERERSEADEEK